MTRWILVNRETRLDSPQARSVDANERDTP